MPACSYPLSDRRSSSAISGAHGLQCRPCRDRKVHGSGHSSSSQETSACEELMQPAEQPPPASPSVSGGAQPWPRTSASVNIMHKPPSSAYAGGSDDGAPCGLPVLSRNRMHGQCSRRVPHSAQARAAARPRMHGQCSRRIPHSAQARAAAPPPRPSCGTQHGVRCPCPGLLAAKAGPVGKAGI